MEGGGEKIVSFSYLVYVIIGLAIGQAIDKLVEYVKIVVSYQETLNSLKAKVEDLTTIISLLPSDDIERKLAVKKWVVELQYLHGDASAMEQKIARINVVSRYRESNKMKQKISEMEKHLKLFPLIQLELILMCQEVEHPADIILDLEAGMSAMGHPDIDSKIGMSAMGHPDIVHKLANVLIKRAAKSSLRRMKMVVYFNREVASLEHLVTSITPIVDEISEIPRLDVYPAIDRWCEKMCELVKEAGEIKSLPWWNIIRRYKDTMDVPNLISTIEAHVKSASLMSLEPLFQELSRKKHRPSGSVIRLEPVSLFQEMIDLESSTQQKKLRPSAQVVETFIEVDASNDEGLRAKLLPMKDS